MLTRTVWSVHFAIAWQEYINSDGAQPPNCETCESFKGISSPSKIIWCWQRLTESMELNFSRIVLCKLQRALFALCKGMTVCGYQLILFSGTTFIENDMEWTRINSFWRTVHIPVGDKATCVCVREREKHTEKNLERNRSRWRRRREWRRQGRKVGIAGEGERERERDTERGREWGGTEEGE